MSIHPYLKGAVFVPLDIQAMLKKPAAQRNPLEQQLATLAYRQITFEYDKIDTLRGMNITIATTAKTDAEAKALLAAFKFPFKN